MLLGDAEQRREHDGHDDGLVVLDQARQVLVVPQKQRTLGHLSTHTRAGDKLKRWRRGVVVSGVRQ